MHDTLCKLYTSDVFNIDSYNYLSPGSMSLSPIYAMSLGDRLQKNRQQKISIYINLGTLKKKK